MAGRTTTRPHGNFTVQKRCGPCLSNDSIDSAGVAVAQFTSDGALISASAAFRTLLNAPPAFDATDVAAAAVGEDRALVEAVLAGDRDHCAFAVAAGTAFLSRIVAGGGERLVCVLTSGGSEAEQGTVDKLLDAVAKASSEWRTTVDAIGSGIILFDRDGTMLRMNRWARDLLGGSGFDDVGSNIDEFATAEPWCCVRDLVREARSSAGPFSRQVSDPGQGTTWEVVVMPPPDRAAGAQLVAVIRDITDRLRLEESVRRSEVMAAMGHLVSGVAHEIRNPIFGIGATVDALEATLGTRTEFAQYAAMLRREVESLKTLTRDLLEYGRPAQPAFRGDRLGRCVAAAAELCAGEAADQGVVIRNEVPSDFGPCRADAHKLVQAFRNVIENAIQHSREGQTVTLTASPWSDDGVAYAACSVHDEGPGFPKDDLAHVFETFFSRRAGGTGLGLSIVQRVVEQHGGKVTARNGARGGAVVTICIPAAAE